MKTQVLLKTDGDVQDLLVYGVLGDVFDGVTSKDFAAALASADTSKPLRVRINSVGGLVNEGMAMKTALDLWDGEVTTHNDALVASAATLPYLAGSKRVMAKGSKFHAHEPWLMTIGPRSEHEKSIRELAVYTDDLVDIYARVSGGEPSKMRSLMAEDTPMNAEDAVESGFATEIAGAAVAACVDKSPHMALFLSEARIAAWAGLLGDDPPEAPTDEVRARETLRIRMELTRRKAQSMIIA
jgi:ATP-dependent protease ClpP protease subunit